MEASMKTRLFASLSFGALVSAAVIASSATPSSAFTLSTTSVKAALSTENIEQVHWWRHKRCWRGRYHHHWHCRYW
jgi:hypothetical protein